MAIHTNGLFAERPDFSEMHFKSRKNNEINKIAQRNCRDIRVFFAWAALESHFYQFPDFWKVVTRPVVLLETPK